LFCSLICQRTFFGLQKKKPSLPPTIPLVKKRKAEAGLHPCPCSTWVFGYRTRCEQWRLGINPRIKSSTTIFCHIKLFLSQQPFHKEQKDRFIQQVIKSLELFGFLKGAAISAECHNLQQQTYRIRSQESGRPATCCIAIATRNRASTQTFLSCRARDAMLHP